MENPAQLLTVVESLRQTDSYAVICDLIAQREPLDAARSLADLAHHLYWKEKDLPRSIAIGKAGIQFALLAADALSAKDSDLAIQLRSTAKGLAFNVASFTWPGWDEPGILITPAFIAAGLEAAFLNLRLANELKKGDLPLSRAYWMLGAHHLTSGQLSKAAEAFTTAAEFAAKAPNTAEELLCKGFHCLTRLADFRDDPQILSELSQIRQNLLPLENGPFYEAQLTTTARILGLTLI